MKIMCEADLSFVAGGEVPPHSGMSNLPWIDPITGLPFENPPIWQPSYPISLG